MLRGILSSAVLGAVLGGCVLISTPITQDEHCAISGATACATCLRQSCAKAIDACCGSILCSGVEGHSPALDGLDSCGNGDRSSCATRFGGAPSSSSSSFDDDDGVRACVAASCKDVCF